MTTILLDTQVWAWSLNEPERLSAAAQTAIADAQTRLVSPISVYEIGQKVRLGKWPAMARFVPRLVELVVEQGAQVAALTAPVCLAATTLDWAHRDPFDRIIAASAIAAGAALVSTDTAFDGLASIRRVW